MRNPILSAAPDKNNSLSSILIIIVLVFLVYFNSLLNSYTHWDDHLYVTENPAIQEFSLQNIKTIFSSIYVGNYAPIHILSYSFDYMIWGDNLFGFHLTNLLLHIANALLLFFLLSRYLSDDKRGIALLASLIFALHPVNVESVAWLSQRKNVLSMFFFLFSLFCYFEQASRQRNSMRYYAASLLFFALSLLTKAVTVTLPLLLILIESIMLPKISKEMFLKIIRNKIPFFLLAIVFSLICLYTQSAHDAIGRNYEGGLYAGLLTGSTVFVYYLKLLLFPVNLSADYVPLVSHSLLEQGPFFSLLLLVSLLIFAFLIRHKGKVVLFFLLWFFITLLPVSNIIPLATLMADRYLYYPTIGFAILTATFSRYLFKQWGYKTSVLIIVIVLSYSCLTQQRNTIWMNDFTLWTDTLKKSPTSIPALNNFAYYYTVKSTNLNKALQLSLQSIALDPNNKNCLDTLSEIYYKRKEYRKAKEVLQKALVLYPGIKSFEERMRMLQIIIP